MIQPNLADNHEDPVPRPAELDSSDVVPVIDDALKADADGVVPYEVPC